MNGWEIDLGTVARLLEAQAPQWSNAPLRRVESFGTDNALFRCGDHHLVRLPRVGWAVGQPFVEARWLPRIAPCLPVVVPVPVFLGAPAFGYPCAWTVVPWIEGANPDPTSAVGEDVATALARCLVALRRVDSAGGPLPGHGNSWRGAPLSARDAQVRAALAALGGSVDGETAAKLWDRALSAPQSPGPGVWIHGDVQPGNVLMRDGALAALIDFGCMGVGDAACDLLPAWNWFTGRARDRFREAMALDDAAWERGRGWALSTALIALPYYRGNNAVVEAQSRRVLERLGVRVY